MCVDYIELIDWAGRAILVNKRVAISTGAPAIIRRLNISPDHWLELSTNLESRFKGLVGSAHSIRVLCKKFGLKRQTNRSNGPGFGIVNITPRLLVPGVN